VFRCEAGIERRGAPLMHVYLALFIAALCGITGAHVSVRTRDGAHFIWNYVNSMATVSSWIYLIKHSTWPLVLSSVIWDTCYMVTFTIALYFIDNNPLTVVQMAGIVITMIGLLLVNT
jgi:drug/metabolite transporter superfamily protein YnfA